MAMDKTLEFKRARRERSRAWSARRRARRAWEAASAEDIPALIVLWAELEAAEARLASLG